MRQQLFYQLKQFAEQALINYFSKTFNPTSLPIELSIIQ